jgi:hypothetical protein
MLFKIPFSVFFLSSSKKVESEYEGRGGKGEKREGMRG